MLIVYDYFFWNDFREKRTGGSSPILKHAIKKPSLFLARGFVYILFADGRTRTGTWGEPRQILSLMRLPISPHRQIFYFQFTSFLGRCGEATASLLPSQKMLNGSHFFRQSATSANILFSIYFIILQ